MHESNGSLTLLSRSVAHSTTAKAAPTASPYFLARLPETTTEYDCSGLTRFNPVGLTNPNPVGNSGIYHLQTCGLRPPSSPIPGIALGGLVPRTKRTALGGHVPRTENTVLGASCPTPNAPA